MEDGSNSEQRGHDPPEDETHFQRNLRNAVVAADPGEDAPDQRCTEESE